MTILPLSPVSPRLPCRERKVRPINGLAWFLLAVAAAAPAAAAEAVLRFGIYDGAARLILEGQGLGSAALTPGEPLTLTLPDIATLSLANAPVGRIRAASARRFEGGTRLVLETEGPLVLRERRLSEGGARLVLDLVPPDRAAPIVEAPVLEAPDRPSADLMAVALPKPKPKPPPPASAATIVIDAGHGGVDPGAIAADGTREKDITLATAKTLRGLLQARGFRVVMTREGDTFLPLRRRVEIARAAGADLFISLHADSLDRADKNQIGGASIYTLSETASDAEAQRLAERENRVDALYGQEIEAADAAIAAMLLDFALRGTIIDSRRFAETLAAGFADERIRLLRNPLRSAGFAVLTAPDVPAVLVELGFLSNPKDQALLRDRKHREKLARALALSIDRYFATVGVDMR
jgi:N-acetylmuramoyl-L-alanine amidase